MVDVAVIEVVVTCQRIDARAFVLAALAVQSVVGSPAGNEGVDRYGVRNVRNPCGNRVLPL
jgi:hypothetical protein